MKIDLSEFKKGWYIEFGPRSYDLTETKTVTDPSAKNCGEEYTSNHGYFGTLPVLFKHFAQIINSRKRGTESLSQYVREYRQLINKLEALLNED